MDQKLFWLIESNEDTSMTVIDLQTCQTIIEQDIDGRPQSELEELEFTIKPVYMTQEEFENLPEGE